ncbi:LOW QUALITY PROTEIN: dual oxidase-like [Liolophura sinensis]|uniref:LOW QUALITY PROTEIN: dual oxidase-like n=1 Tax=Liolophura sinensis TaxID=3198878 RepID=UPI0031586674
MTTGSMLLLLLLQIFLINHGFGQQWQRFDGRFNNLGNVHWGRAGCRLFSNISTCYLDFTYKAPGIRRPNPRDISNNVFRGNGGTKSVNGRTALFAFFGQVVSYEILHTDDSTCPVEVLSVPVPTGDPHFDPDGTGTKFMPYERKLYDTTTGQSPNNPRKQVNKATSYIDGSFIYGYSEVWANALRDHETGKLAKSDTFGRFPQLNTMRLPFDSVPNATGAYVDPESLWTLGDPHVQENPALLSLAVLFYRWHNKLVDDFKEKDPSLTPHELFYTARKWVVATYQKIVMYDWLPKLLNLNESEMEQFIPPYHLKGYQRSVDPRATAVFDAAAMKYILTLIPSEIVLRDLMKDNCVKKSSVRLCNTYWDSQKVLTADVNGVEEILFGLASQPAEKEDTEVVPDIRESFYGPLHYSRHDAVVLTIMKGRDYGLETYNKVRKEIGLGKKSTWEEINNETLNHQPCLKSYYLIKMLDFLHETFNGTQYLDEMDVFVGGMLETTDKGPGELFRTILLDQFLRLRDGDRFWFENKENGQFTKDEIDIIKHTTLGEIINNVTGQLRHGKLQPDVFTLGTGEFCHFEPVNASSLPECPPHTGYDYFSGSEISFIVIWTCVGILPFLCGLLAYVLYHIKHHRDAESLKQKRNERLRRLVRVTSGWITAIEWRGEKESPRNVELQFHDRNCQLWMSSHHGSHIRTISFHNMAHVELWLSSTKGQTTLLIYVPREYDLVLEFPTVHERSLFVSSIEQLLTNCEKEIVQKSMKLKEIYQRATTKVKRNQKLEMFFKQVFSEALDMDYVPVRDSDNMETLDFELTKEEFAEALGVKSDSDFVMQMFNMVDNNADGYISFKEFLATVVLFSKGSSEDKLHMLFKMCSSHEEGGTVTMQELTTLFKSLLEMANSDVDVASVEKIVTDMCTVCGVQNNARIGFPEFCQIFSPQMDHLNNINLDWKGAKKCLSPANGKKTDKKSHQQKRKGSTASLDIDSRKGSTMSLDRVSHKGSTSSLNEIIHPRLQLALREKYSPVKAKVKSLKHFIENNKQHIFFLIIFFGICLGVAGERFYYYTIEREHSGLRQITGLGLSVTRAAAAGMSFTFSLILLTMCRNTITWLRGTFLNFYIPFDSHVAFHKVIAWTALFFTAMHVIGYGFNFYHVATQPTKFLCVFETIVFRSEFQPAFHWWLFGNMTGFTGVLLTVVICIIYVFATQTARRYIFGAFWLTHKLILPLYIMAILHGASVIVQKPLFFAYFVIPAILLTVDKLVSLSRKKSPISVVRAEHLPSDVTMIEFKRPPRFEYKSGQWVRVACLGQSPSEYHPFTLTSAPHEDTLSVHVRALGPWTWNIRSLFDPENLKDRAYPKLYVDGPYGAGQQDWYTYDVSILVGAGIGVTPYASILKDFVHMSQIKSTYKIRCQKLYFVWVTGSQRHYEWLIDILRQVEDVDLSGIVTIDIFITQFFQKFDLRTALLYICEEHFQKLSGGRSVFTGLKANTHFGRPQLSKMMEAVNKSHPQVRKVGVFSCGPPGLTKGVEKACMESSRTTKALFEHHFENF